MPQFIVGWWLLLSAVLAGASSLVHADGLAAIPALTARVTDTTATLSAAQIAQLDGELAAFEASKGSQIAVLIVPSTQPEPIESYSLRVVEAWKLGRKKVDDGVLLIVAKNDRRLRIEVGYGLEGALTDAGSRRIIAETITPRFKAGDFYGGIEAGVRQIMAVVSGEALPEVSKATGAESAAPQEVLGGIILLVSGVLSALVGRMLPWPVRMLTAAVLATVVGVMMSSFLLAILCFFGFLFFGSRAGSSFVTTAGNASTWRGGGGFGGVGSFGGGGGFSGGGGGFGGGGSSGSW